MTVIAITNSRNHSIIEQRTMGNRSSLNTALFYAVASLALCSHTIHGFAVLSNSHTRRWRTDDEANVCARCRRQQPSLRLAAINGKHLSAADRERRDEEKRRKERQGEVIIGKTSARPGEKDFPLDPKATEMDYLRQASAVEQEVFRQTEHGMEMLKMLRLDEACQAFDRVFELRPNAYLWQAGIAKFYQDDLQGAAEIFARCAAVFESKFGEPASEERIWHDACELKLINSLSRKERKEVLEAGEVSNLITPIPDRGAAAELIKSESRKVIRIARDLFSSTVDSDYPTMILSRAKLRSIGGEFKDRPATDRKMWKLNSWYYLGLHYDAISEFDEAKECMKMALSMCPSSGNANDIVHTLPLLHMSRREWFDDLEMSWNPLNKLATSTDLTLPWMDVPTLVNDPLILNSIHGSVSKMRTLELKSALHARGLKSEGSKEQLQRKFFKSLVNDDGWLGW